MSIFRRRKIDDDFSEENEPRRVKLHGQHKRKKSIDHKPWSKGERVLLGLIFGSTIIGAIILAFSSRHGKLPGLPRLSIPNLGFSETVILENKTPTPMQKEVSTEILQDITNKTRNLSGIYAVVIIDLKSGNSFGINQNEVMEAASLIKLPVMVSAYLESEGGRFALDSKYSLKESDKLEGSGSIIGKPAGTQLTYRELIKYMGQQSDNTAFNVIHKKLGDSLISRYLDNWGMKNTSVASNLTTPQEIANLLKRVYEGSLISKKNSDELFKFLTKTIYEEYLPNGVPEEVVVSHKYGRLIHVINDAGVVFATKPYVIVIMTGGVVESEAEKIIPELSKIVYEGMEN